MGREDLHALNPVYSILAGLDSLGQVPEIEINQDTTDVHPWLLPDIAPQPQNLVPDPLDTEDACCSDTDLDVGSGGDVVAVLQCVLE